MPLAGFICNHFRQCGLAPCSQAGRCTMNMGRHGEHDLTWKEVNTNAQLCFLFVTDSSVAMIATVPAGEGGACPRAVLCALRGRQRLACQHPCAADLGCARHMLDVQRIDAGMADQHAGQHAQLLIHSHHIAAARGCAGGKQDHDSKGLNKGVLIPSNKRQLAHHVELWGAVGEDCQPPTQCGRA